MFRNILIPTDGSSLATVAVDAAVAFAKEVGANITVFTVMEPFHLFTSSSYQLGSTREEYEALSREHAAQTLAAAQAQAERAGVACATDQVRSHEVFRAIIQKAEDIGADLIVMASHGRSGVGALIVGSVTAKVLTHSTIPVLVYRKK
ncbi:universal stress protein [Sinorhizobium terangae]|uniref:Universal stress protein n=1 Tax=Sinorhizobium terangae TaxID=110322 RepID=A0A6N7LN72_SINTE|nr:universal stress protein [Sinorhizobium terangae]MBB4184392.1 nucleotide-binding universal stress UspA family protein [Sinorhizobium terangae]MQX19116.1 universal stress protein [Sinorhizobium terangae]WFU50359.1 universal stress protein [Sinorhizobium terangae]